MPNSNGAPTPQADGKTKASSLHESASGETSSGESSSAETQAGGPRPGESRPSDSPKDRLPPGRDSAEMSENARRLERLLKRLEEATDELELDEKSLETVLSNVLEDFDRDLDEVLEKTKEGVEEMGMQLNAPIKAVLRALEDDLQETAAQLERQGDKLVEEGTKRYEQVAVVKGELQSLARDLDKTVDTYRGSTEEIANLRDNLKEEVERAQATASILEGAALDQDIDKLQRTFENHIKEVVQVGQDMQEKMQKKMRSHFKEMCNRLDERRKNMDHRVKSTMKMINQKEGEIKAVRAAVEDSEKRVDDQIEELVAQTKAITMRRALLILTASFCGTLSAILLANYLLSVMPFP